MEIMDLIDIKIVKTVDIVSNKLKKIEVLEKEKLKAVIKVLDENKLSSLPCQVVYRGVKESLLLESLVKNIEEINPSKLIEYLFYYGDKAKYYYKKIDEERGKKRWINKIEETSRFTAMNLFMDIKSVIEKNLDFQEKASEFSEYFLSDNKENFIKYISSNNKLRNYYLYFLHTSGDLSNQSLLVSTSKSIESAKKFLNCEETGYLFLYVIPAETDKYSITHLDTKLDKYVKNISSSLPIYDHVSLFPDEEEVSVIGALFPHHILGVLKYEVKKEVYFIPNPHLFTIENDNVNSILKGLYIDQSEFQEKYKNETNLIQAISIQLEKSGEINYSTI